MFIKDKIITIKRIQSGIKQYELAEMLGFSKSKMSAIEHGYASICPEVLSRIHEILDETLQKNIK